MRRLLTLGPDNEPLWVRLYVHRVSDTWAAMIVADEAMPEPVSLTGTAFFGEAPQEVEEQAKTHVGLREPFN